MSEGGYVIAKKIGTAVITATTTIGVLTISDSSTVVVRSAVAYDSVVIEARSEGWTPALAHIKAGGKVEWRGGNIAAVGLPTSKLYVWNAETPQTYEEFDLNKGPLSKIFLQPGRYEYCSNACWDPPEWGSVVVH